MSFSGIFIHCPVATTLLALAISPRSHALRWNAGLGRAGLTAARCVLVPTQRVGTRKNPVEREDGELR